MLRLNTSKQHKRTRAERNTAQYSVREQVRRKKLKSESHPLNGRSLSTADLVGEGGVSEKSHEEEERDYEGKKKISRKQQY